MNKYIDICIWAMIAMLAIATVMHINQVVGAEFSPKAQIVENHRKMDDERLTKACVNAHLQGDYTMEDYYCDALEERKGNLTITEEDGIVIINFE